MDPATHRRFVAAESHVSRFTVPFCWEAQGTEDKGVAGSGVLIEIAGRRFIVTAAHVLEDIVAAEQQHGAGFVWGIPVATSGGLWDPSEIHFPGDMVRLMANPSDPRVDVGLIELKAPGITDVLLKQRDFVTIDRIDFKLSDSDYFVYGYPIERTKKSTTRLHMDPFRFATSLRLEPKKWPSFTDTKHNLVLEKPENAILSDGSNVALPDREGLVGISGCGVWSVGAGAGESVSTASSHIRLTAVQTCVPDPYKCIVATRWAVVAAVLKKHDPVAFGSLLDAAYAQSMRRTTL